MAKKLHSMQETPEKKKYQEIYFLVLQFSFHLPFF